MVAQQAAQPAKRRRRSEPAVNPFVARALARHGVKCVEVDPGMYDKRSGNAWGVLIVMRPPY